MNPARPLQCPRVCLTVTLPGGLVSRAGRRGSSGRAPGLWGRVLLPRCPWQSIARACRSPVLQMEADTPVGRKRRSLPDRGHGHRQSPASAHQGRIPRVHPCQHPPHAASSPRPISALRCVGPAGGDRAPQLTT